MQRFVALAALFLQLIATTLWIPALADQPATGFRGRSGLTSFSATPSGIFDVATPTTAPALSLDTQAANIVLAGPTSGGAATPAFRSLVIADIPTITAAKGGTGITSYTAGDLLTATGATTLSAFAKGTADQVLSMNAGATTQEWKTVTAGAGITVTPGVGTLTIAATGGGGTVTSVSITPTSVFDVADPTGAAAISMDTQTANQVLASATSGGAAVPAFRALVAADMPATVALTNAGNSWSAAQVPNAAGTIDLGSSALPFQNVYVGGAATNNNKIASATCTAARTFTLPDANSNSVIPDTGASNNFLTAISSGGVISKAQPSFSNISGTATVSQGGTGATSLTNHGVVIGQATSAVAVTSAGTAGQVLTSNGAGADPTFQAAPASTTGFTSSNQTITSGGSLTIAHSLSSTPKHIVWALKCLSAENGYSTNDIVFQHDWDSSNNAGCAVVPDATNLNVRIGSRANPFRILNKSTGTTADITTNSNWAIIFYASL